MFVGVNLKRTTIIVQNKDDKDFLILLNHELGGLINVSESLWNFSEKDDNGLLTLELSKKKEDNNIDKYHEIIDRTRYFSPESVVRIKSNPKSPITSKIINVENNSILAMLNIELAESKIKNFCKKF